MKTAHWNGEPCEAKTGTVIVGKSARSTWWCAKMGGERRKCVRVDVGGEIFFIDDEDGSGSHKVFETMGGPFCAPHSSVPVDNESSFVPSPGS